MPLVNLEQDPELLNIFHEVPSSVLVCGSTPAAYKTVNIGAERLQKATHGVDFPAPL